MPNTLEYSRPSRPQARTFRGRYEPPPAQPDTTTLSRTSSTRWKKCQCSCFQRFTTSPISISSPHRIIIFLGLLLISSRVITLTYNFPSLLQGALEPTVAINEKFASTEADHKIPKIVHQSYKTQDLPVEWVNTPKLWQSHMPDYQYLFWTDEMNRNFIQNHYPWFLHIYDSYKYPIQRAYAARYFVVLTYGGIYADLDLTPVKNITNLLSSIPPGVEMMVAETHSHDFSNCLFAAVPNSTLLYTLTHYVLPKHHRPSMAWGTVMTHRFEVEWSAGNKLFSKFLSSQTAYQRKIMNILPQTWGQCKPCSRDCSVHQDTYFITTKGGTWHRWDSYVMRYCKCHIQLVLWIVLIGLFIFMRCVHSAWSRFCCRKRYTKHNNIPEHEVNPLIYSKRSALEKTKNLDTLMPYTIFWWKKVEKDELFGYVIITLALIFM